MNTYRGLARHYDTLTADVDYPGWADFLEKLFKRSAIPVHTVLDLACGTGSLTAILAERGYETIGADASAEMLAQAAGKTLGITGIRPLFIRQGMTELDLYGTVDAVVCCLDSVNHLKGPGELSSMFSRVKLFLAPGGVFIFAVNSAEKLKGLDGELFLDEREDLFCAWRGEYSKSSRTCRLWYDIFERDGECWIRSDDTVEEYAFEVPEITGALAAAGFEDVRTYGDRKMRPPKPGEDRIFYCSKRGNNFNGR